MKLTIKNASYSYEKSRTIIKDISFSVKEGEIMCLLGPNGTGKTTLFRVILGLLKLQDGKILINNENTKAWPKKKLAKYISYVPQNHVPPFPYNVIDVVLMGRTAHLHAFSSPHKEDYKIAYEALETLDISHLKNRNYIELSGGERKLVLIARALAQKSKILIMDEPTSSLDYGNQIKVLKYLKKLTKLKISVIMSSHFPNHAMHYADKTALMKDGKLLFVGRPEEILTEKNLKEIYGVNIEVLNITRKPRRNLKVCVSVG